MSVLVDLVSFPGFICGSPTTWSTTASRSTLAREDILTSMDHTMLVLQVNWSPATCTWTWWSVAPWRSWLTLSPSLHFWSEQFWSHVLQYPFQCRLGRRFSLSSFMGFAGLTLLLTQATGDQTAKVGFCQISCLNFWEIWNQLYEIPSYTILSIHDCRQCLHC